jgi:hypothetical protein
MLAEVVASDGPITDALKRVLSQMVVDWAHSRHAGATFSQRVLVSCPEGPNPPCEMEDVQSDLPLLVGGERLAGGEGDEELGECRHATMIVGGVSDASFTRAPAGVHNAGTSCTPPMTSGRRSRIRGLR